MGKWKHILEHLSPFDQFRAKVDPLHTAVQQRRTQADQDVQLINNQRTAAVSVAAAVDLLLGLVFFSLVWRQLALLRETQRASLYTRRILDSMRDSVFVVDPVRARVQDANRASEALTGYSHDELVGVDVARLRVPEERDGVRAMLEAAVQSGGTTAPYTVTWLRRDGLRIPMEFVNTVSEISGQTAIVSVGRDITTRLEVEATLREANRRLETALTDLKQAQSTLVQQERLRALGEMASGIAHDFNNALSPILGFSELLLIDPAVLADPALTEQYLTLINTGAQDAAKVVKRMREFYRTRDQDEVVAPVNLNAVVPEVLDLTQPRWRDQALAQGRSITAWAELEEVPLVGGNEAELREVLINLIFNAVDALPEGGTITLRTHAEDGQVLVQVEDTGTGMPPEVRARALAPFFTTKGAQGTGLGLATSYGIIRRHGGTLAIESQVGKGTTIDIRLPQYSEQPVVPASPDTAPAAVLHVLVVDDEPLVREVLVSYLALDGHTAQTAANGREGLEAFQSGRFDVVLTDMAMPEISGEQLAAAVKAVAPGTPVILSTGFGDILAVQDARPEGVDVILTKPITITQLRRALAEVFLRQGEPNETGVT